MECDCLAAGTVLQTYVLLLYLQLPPSLCIHPVVQKLQVMSWLGLLKIMLCAVFAPRSCQAC